jgi:hypothetical protein
METPEPRQARKTAAVPVLDAQNILWYFGALAGTVACVAIVGQIHDSARGAWILLASLVFLAIYAAASFVLLREGWIIPAGVIAATAVSFVPLGGAAFERLVGVGGKSGIVSGTSAVVGDTVFQEGESPTGSTFQAFHWHSFVLALATVAAGLLVYSLVRYAYVFAWVAIAALIGTQILLPAFQSHPAADEQVDALLVAGLGFVAIGLYADLAHHARRVAFWWHLVGLWSVAVALSYHTADHSSPGWIFVVLAGLAALAIAAPLERATFAFFGLLGVYAPFVHYGDHWFGNLGLAFTLAVVGFSILAAGLAIQQSGSRWVGILARRPPAPAI